jgi:general secretion pathway protein I
MRRYAQGFTLIEVLVALVIVAFGAGALMATLTSAADTVGHLRDKSFAEWIALNQISELRLDVSRPSPGEASGELEYAGQRWRWRREITDQGMFDMLRIEMTVSRVAEGGQEPPNLATAWGFIGRTVGAASGRDPDWSVEPLNTGGGSNGGPGGGAGGSTGGSP